MTKRQLATAAVALGLAVGLAAGFALGRGGGPPSARADGNAAATPKPPDSVKKKLEEMNKLLKLLRDRVQNGETPQDALVVLEQIEELKQNLVRDLDETWQGASSWIIDLLAIDNALQRAQIYALLGAKKALLSGLEGALESKEGMEKALKLAGKPSRPFRVGLAVTRDHEPPQSDACVEISTRKPVQPGARALAMLSGQGEDAVAGTPLREVELDARGKAKVRFPVNQIGVFQFDVVVVSKRGHSMFASRAFDNSEPSAKACNA